MAVNQSVKQSIESEKVERTPHQHRLVLTSAARVQCEQLPHKSLKYSGCGFGDLLSNLFKPANRLKCQTNRRVVKLKISQNKQQKNEQK